MRYRRFECEEGVLDGVFDVFRFEARAVSPKPDEAVDPTVMAINQRLHRPWAFSFPGRQDQFFVCQLGEWARACAQRFHPLTSLFAEVVRHDAT